MAYYDAWSENPSENNQAPPFGAGEAKMPFDQITDTFRVVMAACKQLAGSTIGTIKSMAFQSHEAVYIIGGNITAGVSIAAEALQVGTLALARLPTSLVGKYCDGLTLFGVQNLYNLVHPVGQVTLWHSVDPYTSLLIWPGVTAVWQEIVAGRDLMIVVHGTRTGLLQGGGSQMPGSGYSVGTESGHTHSIPAGGTAGMQLDATQVPAITSSDNLLAVTPGAAANVVPKTAALAHTGVAAVAHAHTTPASNTGPGVPHAHGYTFDPVRFGFALMQRIS